MAAKVHTVQASFCWSCLFGRLTSHGSGGKFTPKCMRTRHRVLRPLERSRRTMQSFVPQISKCNTKFWWLDHLLFPLNPRLTVSCKIYNTGSADGKWKMEPLLYDERSLLWSNTYCSVRLTFAGWVWWILAHPMFARMKILIGTLHKRFTSSELFLGSCAPLHLVSIHFVDINFVNTLTSATFNWSTNSSNRPHI